VKLEICILYPDLLNSYGDTGNSSILAHRASEHGIDAEVHYVSLSDTFNPDAYDILLIGGGQFHEQSIVAEDLRKEKGGLLKEYIHAGKVALLVCGAYQLAGEYYVDDHGEREDGLGILPVYSQPGKTRMIGDLVIKDPNGTVYTGFENHLGKTYIGDLEPLGKVVSGFGNNGEDGYEGCRFKNTIGTYLHGPLLSKNPELADWMIKTALELKGNDVELRIIDDSWEKAARDTIVRRIEGA
jgi:CobQ-like glutamine amidotransferase family enzyme